MRLVLTGGEWWWVQCLCGSDTCEDNPTQKPFIFTPARLATVRTAQVSREARDSLV